MKHLILWIAIYTLVLAYSQVLLKIGMSKIGAIQIKEFQDVINLAFLVIREYHLIIGIILMASSFFLWLVILSWFKLSLVYPLTSVGFIFVALLSFFMLNEKLTLFNYFGILLIAFGMFFLLYKQA